MRDEERKSTKDLDDDGGFSRPGALPERGSEEHRTAKKAFLDHLAKPLEGGMEEKLQAEREVPEPFDKKLDLAQAFRDIQDHGAGMFGRGEYLEITSRAYHAESQAAELEGLAEKYAGERVMTPVEVTDLLRAEGVKDVDKLQRAYCGAWAFAFKSLEEQKTAMADAGCIQKYRTKAEEENRVLKERLVRADKTIGFFASVIKAGEPWTYKCQEKLDDERCLCYEEEPNGRSLKLEPGCPVHDSETEREPTHPKSAPTEERRPRRGRITCSICRDGRQGSPHDCPDEIPEGGPE